MLKSDYFLNWTQIKILRDFCPSTDSLCNYDFDASQKNHKKELKTNPYELSGLVQIF